MFSRRSNESQDAKKTILVVDDARATRRLFRRALEECGVEVLEAEDGRIALDVVRSGSHIDVAMVDWHMPNMNGLEFVQELRKNKAYDGIKVVMVTAESDMQNATQAIAAGATDYLIKPFSKKLLLQKLNTMGLDLGS